MKPIFHDPASVFDMAIKAGRLSLDADSPLYAGHYMYMGTYSGEDQFKHVVTRKYLPILRVVVDNRGVTKAI